MAPGLSRKALLVLQGPSSVGKTEYVRTLFGPGEVLEMNCAGLTTVCMSGFDRRLHRCLLWDEAGPRMIAQNRKIFQHPPCLVDIGHSPTGAFVQRLWLNDAVSVVTCNGWHEELQKLPLADQLWLRANVVVVEISRPMWCGPSP